MTHTQSSPITFEGGAILGYPRIGANRELKRALESYWAGKISASELEDVARQLRLSTYRHLHSLGLAADNGAIPADFSYYDQVLDTLITLGGLPERITANNDSDDFVYKNYFVAARGKGAVQPLEMTKWFDTNYHYLVPEIAPDTSFTVAHNIPAELFTEGLKNGFVTRPYLVGPVTLLALAKPAQGAPKDFNPLARLDDILPVYAQVLKELATLDAPWVQLDESALVSETLPNSPEELAAAAEHTYDYLGNLASRPKILVQASYSELSEAARLALGNSAVEAVALDLVHGKVPSDDVLAKKTVLAGVIDGHNVWRADLDKALEKVRELEKHAGEVVISTATSLLHVPHTLEVEVDLPQDVRSWLAFADEKIGEVNVLDSVYRGSANVDAFEEARTALASRNVNPNVHREDVRSRLDALNEGDFARVPYAERAAAQATALGLPLLPTTTIGSFPQVPEIRAARAAFARGESSVEEYNEAMREHIRYVIDLQEQIGLDVLVHGEAERNDMVQYFAENFDGFSVTRNGWVQSYGSRCTRPSILWGDVSRPKPFTVQWISYAQSLTDKPVKGMLTGPVTILAWSFVREDQPREVTANQVALALRDEIADLEAAGVKIVQVDEPAIRELLPLKKADHEDYLNWSVRSFRLSTAAARPETQIHTHLCYSEFGQIFDAVDGLDADVTSIEAERSKMEIVEDIERAGFARGIGPGVYDIHSPRVPSVEDIEHLIDSASAHIAKELLWINPDCGLKTRRYEEVVPALTAMVEATRTARG